MDMEMEHVTPEVFSFFYYGLCSLRNEAQRSLQLLQEDSNIKQDPAFQEYIVSGCTKLMEHLMAINPEPPSLTEHFSKQK